MRYLVLAGLLILDGGPTVAETYCGNYSGAELYEQPANRAVEAYIDSGSRKDQRKACERSQLALKIWNEGVDHCEARPECSTNKFKARCREISERVVLWSETVNKVCAGL